MQIGERQARAAAGESRAFACRRRRARSRRAHRAAGAAASRSPRSRPAIRACAVNSSMRSVRSLNAGMYPRIPSQGSVGASGDLAPLAHLSGCAARRRARRSWTGEIVPAARCADRRRVSSLWRSRRKRASHCSTARRCRPRSRLPRCFAPSTCSPRSLVAGAMSADAIKGSDTPFDARIQQVRGHRGADRRRRLVAGTAWPAARSALRTSNATACRIRIPFAASRRSPAPVSTCCAHVGRVLETEANAVTDNPLVFTDTGAVLSGGNFHAEPVAFAADYLALAIAEIGSLSERRIALLIDSHLSRPAAVPGRGKRAEFGLHDARRLPPRRSRRRTSRWRIRRASTAFRPRQTRKIT